MSSDYAMICDFGLCRPVNYNKLDIKNKAYGVLPYIAPEILTRQNFTKASDIYSFGIIMYEVISGLPPYHDIAHNMDLARKICVGHRPRFNIKVPKLIVHLIKKCLDANPSNRSTSEEIKNILYLWCHDFNNQTELKKQIEEAEEINCKYPTESISTRLGSSYNSTHSEAIYTSRLLDFNNLPEPKNSEDYYEENDNIISMRFSESLQIDISQLNTSNDYYKQNNIIMSQKFSESLQIDISQLKTDKTKLIEPKTSNDYYKQNDIIMSKKLSVKYDHSKPNSILLKSSIIKKVSDHETKEVVQVQVTDKVAKIQRKSTIIKNIDKLKQNERKIEVLRNKLDEETKK
ncbi:kinase-like protein [Rhizophagus irregularis]|uniref:Kinase-like protein n=1 Tax=Rhizophagus irregularis TaxID=588596 RepID=A0A2N0NGL6_9GLOM|nr:kinase-like protein [Rhizophagus irregularis]